MKWLISFLKKPEEFVKNLDLKNTIIIFLVAMIVKITYNIISDHSFPPEMNFEFAGITNPKFYEFVLSYLISEFLFLGIFLSFFIINIKKRFIISLLLNLLLILIFYFAISSNSKNYMLLSLFIIIISLFFFTLKIFKDWIVSLKIMISLKILNIISTILLYLSEIISSNIIAISVLFVYSLFSFAYFVKMFRAFYDVSVKKIIISSISAAIISAFCGYIIYKADLFSQNTVKLILYN